MKNSIRFFWLLFLFGFLGFIVIVLFANFGVFGKMPSLRELENPSIVQSSEVLAVDGTLMGKYNTEKSKVGAK